MCGACDCWCARNSPWKPIYGFFPDVVCNAALLFLYACKLTISVTIMCMLLIYYYYHCFFILVAHCTVVAVGFYGDVALLFCCFLHGMYYCCY